MGRWVSPGRKTWMGGLVLVLFLTLAGIAWAERSWILARYYAYRLSQAGEDDRGIWVERVAHLGDSALPVLLDSLAGGDDRTCANARAALAHLVGGWELQDPRRTALLEHLASRFSQLSPAGQPRALELEDVLCPGGAGLPPLPLTQAAMRLLTEAVRSADKEIRATALGLTEKLVTPKTAPELLSSFRELTRLGLRDSEPANRIQAVRVAMQAPVNLFEEVAILLRDPAAEVRRTALLAVGAAPQAVATDDLLHWLHDPDARVRRQCEAVLRRRGLRDDHIHLGRLLTDAEAKTRLQVLDYLRHTTELEPSVWLRRLSHDPVAAVRAAAIRAATEFPSVDISDRIEQIAQNDPSPTVRQLAQYYLSCRKPHAGRSAD